MLQELSIKHFAIIDDLRISFSEGLTVLTGETGAGKSIIINAVNLLLGSRASARLIRTGHETAELEALFLVAANSSVAGIMAEQGLDSAEGLLIRRVISRNDRHRIYINGRLATIQILNSITENLASISGQHAHQGLLKEDQHLLILDQFDGLMPLRTKVEESFKSIQPLIRKLKELENLRGRQVERIELLEFQKNEIAQASITPGEDEALERERTRLKHAETLYQTVHGGIEELYSSEGAIIERLLEVQKQIDAASQIDPALSANAENLSDSAFRLEDITENLRDYLNTVQQDDRLLEETEARLDTLNKLKRKYGGSLEAVLAHFEAISMELSGLENIETRISQAKTELTERHQALTATATSLSTKRRKAAKIMTRKVENELATLEMPQSRFEVSVEPIPANDGIEPYLTVEGNLITETGIDRAVFMMAPNPGEALKPLAKIASGGELSRVVLALKAILAAKESLETVVFDEVDAGIGGSVAEVVGKKIASLADVHQIICITHLAQIAKFGTHHFNISKHVAGGRTQTVIHKLNKAERIEEIARMLGGIEITPATLEHAREMLANQ